MFPDVIITDTKDYITLKGQEEDLKNNYLKIKAAHVIPAKAGIHDYVSVFDFAGLYPSIFRTFNISPDTICENALEIDDIQMELQGQHEEVINAYTFNVNYKQDKKGIYPVVLEELTKRRKVHKSKLGVLKEKYRKNDSRYFLELYRSDVLKQVSNSLYGVGSFVKFPIFNPKVSASVTSIARKAIKFAEKYCLDNGYDVLTGDTDSIMVKHSKDENVEELGNKLNTELKNWVFDTWKNINQDNYCMELEYEKTYKTFVMKPAKKKYYGFLIDGTFEAKGFDIIQHSYSNTIKDMIKELYIDLMNRLPEDEIKSKLNIIKEKFYKLDTQDLYIEWKIAKNLDEYNTNIRHIRAGQYSNKYLNTNFKSGSVGKLIFIKKSTDLEKYPNTDVLLLDEKIELPKELKIDYDVFWEKLIIDKLKLLNEIPEMQIDYILSEELEKINIMNKSKNKIAVLTRKIADLQKNNKLLDDFF
jgi:DNA polymerase I